MLQVVIGLGVNAVDNVVRASDILVSEQQPIS